MDVQKNGVRKKKSTRRVKGGYELLAFGGIEDAVRLLFLDQPDPAELERMNLFNIAEIRRPPSGGMEIKFYDRIKALECLERMEAEAGQFALYDALQAGAEALKKDEGHA